MKSVAADLLVSTDLGLYCPAGDFYIDPWKPVPRAIITHAHSDHARWGHQRYLCSSEGADVLHNRLGNVSLQTLPYGQRLRIRDVEVSLHPAGHILGSAQVRIEGTGGVCVVSGDYKTEIDGTCTAFEPVPCDLFVTESTFGLPIYQWQPQREVFAEINNWWRQCQQEGRVAVLYAYSLGKAQRILAGLDATIGPIVVHGAMEGPTAAYRAGGIELPDTLPWQSYVAGKQGKRLPLVLAPPSTDGTPWLKRFGEISTAFASGWMLLRGTRRRQNLDRGFVLSDHVDWPSMLAAIEATGASEVRVTHGYVDTVVRYLNETGIAGRPVAALPLHTLFEGEGGEAAELKKETFIKESE